MERKRRDGLSRRALTNVALRAGLARGAARAALLGAAQTAGAARAAMLAAVLFAAALRDVVRAAMRDVARAAMQGAAQTAGAARAAMLAAVLFAAAAWPGLPAGASDEPAPPDAVAAAPAGRVFTVAEAAAAAQAWLEERHGADWSRFEILDTRWPNGSPPPEARLGLLTGEGAPTANGTLLLYAEVGAGNAPPARVPLRLTVRPYVDVSVAARAIARGTVLAAADVRVEERPLEDLHGGVAVCAAPSCQATGGSRRLRARRAIKAGEVLTASSVEEPPVVISGSRVTIRLEAGPIRLATTGTARRGGKVGEIIPVENVESRRLLLAEVLDERTVRMIP